MKLKDIVGLDNTYTLLANDNLSIATAYKLNKLFLDYQEDLKFYKEQYHKIIIDNASKDESGTVIYDESNNVTIPAKDIEMVGNLVDELLKIEIADSTITFSIDEFQNSSITPAQMLPLMKFIK